MGETEALIQEFCDWKLYGAVAWHFCLFILSTTCWFVMAWPGSSHYQQITAFSAWFYALVVYGSMLLVLVTQRRVLTTLDVPPLYVARLGWSGKSWPSLLIARCLIRTRRLWDILNVLLFYAACCCSACLGMYLLKPPGVTVGPVPLLVYGLALGLMYGMGYMIRGKNVLSFPILQRHRYFRIKQRMRALARSTLLLSSMSLLLALPVAQLLQQGWGSVQGTVACWRSALLLCFGWGAGAHMLEIVFTERVALASDDDPQPTAPLLAALQHKDPIVQDWCLMDLAAVAEGSAGCIGRRAALFSDETGASGWIPLTRYCLAELRDFVGVMSQALPAVSGAASSGAGVRWNMLQLSAAGAHAASKQHDLAVWHLQARYYRLLWCMRVLSGLAAAGLKLDKFGVLQLCSPGLSDVLITQLGVVAVLQTFLKRTSSIPSHPATPTARLMQQLLVVTGSSSSPSGEASRAAQQHVDVATCSLLDTAKTCTYRITNTYGAVLTSVVAQCKPLVGSAADATALLNSFLQYQE